MMQKFVPHYKNDAIIGSRCVSLLSLLALTIISITNSISRTTFVTADIQNCLLY